MVCRMTESPTFPSSRISDDSIWQYEEKGQQYQVKSRELDDKRDTDTSDHENGPAPTDKQKSHAMVSAPETLAPSLVHRMKNERSILALAVSSDRIFAGTQGGQILVYDLDTFARVATIEGHRGSVLSLCLSEDEGLIFSGAGDRIVNAWDTHKYTRIYSIFSAYDIGDIFCVAYSPKLQTVYLGAQNTSIQWYDLKEKDLRPCPKFTAHPSRREDRFFDSSGPGGIRTPRPQDSQSDPLDAIGGQILELDKTNIHQFAHYGYVYCMLLTGCLAAYDHSEILISGGGDGVIRLWSLDQEAGGRINEIATLDDGRQEGASVLTISIEGSFLYSGRVNGEVNVWDLETRQLVRSLKAQTDDVLTLSLGGGFLFAAGASGKVHKFGPHYETIAHFNGHSGRILASAFTTHNGRPQFITGGSDDTVAVWDIKDCVSTPTPVEKSSNERMVETLRAFVAHKTVSSDPRFKVDCRRGASFLRSTLRAFGAVTHMLNTEGSLNPVILGIFKGNPSKAASRKRILFYGHYDVIAARNEKGRWYTDPFSMAGIDGYLYGRGTSDNKGPITAAIYAVAELTAEKALDSDIIFLIEGEEECGSRGFSKAVEDNKNLIGDVDWILLANSYWLDDFVPCLTYGLRGVIHASVSIKSQHPDLHSGVDGSALLDESLKDLVMLVSKLTGPKGKVEIPGFYDPIPPITKDEQKLYDQITHSLIQRNPDLGDPEQISMSLMRRWREASLTIHRFRNSGPENSTIIPSHAEASLSLRLVPNQDTDKIAGDLKDFLHTEFGKLGSKNQLTVSIDHKAEPWLGDYTNEIFQTLESAIRDVWEPFQARQSPIRTRNNSMSLEKSASPATSSVLANGSSASPVDGDEHSAIDGDQQNLQPLYIREGGSIPSIRFLEKAFGAPAAQLPCGQASDSAHLDNERLRLINLYKSKDILKKVFRDLPQK